MANDDADLAADSDQFELVGRTEGRPGQILDHLLEEVLRRLDTIATPATANIRRSVTSTAGQ